MKAFSTERNSADTALKWRESIYLEKALEIQKICKDEMKKLNYIQVQDILNNSTEVIEPFSPQTLK